MCADVEDDDSVIDVDDDNDGDCFGLSFGSDGGDTYIGRDYS